MAQVSKPFRELTKGEAEKIIRGIVNSSHSEEEIRRRLTEAGFSGAHAAVYTHSFGDMFQAMVMVCSPRGEIISV